MSVGLKRQKSPPPAPISYGPSLSILSKQVMEGGRGPGREAETSARQLPPSESKVGPRPLPLDLAPSQPAVRHGPEDPPPATPAFPRSPRRELITYSSFVKICPSLFLRRLNSVPTTSEVPTGRDKGRAFVPPTPTPPAPQRSPAEVSTRWDNGGNAFPPLVLKVRFLARQHQHHLVTC